MKAAPYIAALLFALPLYSSALSVPKAGPKDYRVKFVDYNADEVFRVKAFYLRNLRIQLAPGEQVVDIGIGDPVAWDHVPSGNNIFLKPKYENATTNMSVVTNRRTYEFELHASKPPKSGDYVDLTYAIKFRYPEEAAALQLAEQRRKEAEGLLDTDPELDQNTNWNYWVQGSESLSPDRAYDDRRFTYLRFSHNKDMPAVYAIDETGSEALVNTHVEGDFIVVHKIAQQFVLRRGSMVACVFNKSYDPKGLSSESGTVSDSVTRVIRK